MPNLHLFNPENDLALAHGAANFTPSKPVQLFHNALQALPLWYAEQGDCVYAPGVSPQWWSDTCTHHGIADVKQGRIGTPTPWGWSAHAVQQFRRIGVDAPQMFPNVELIRQLSHRRTALLLHRHLRAHGALPYPLPPAPVEATNADEAMELLTSGGDYFIKAPWSSSGRGVMDSSCMPPAQLQRQVQGIIARQGSIMIERKLQRVRDFAMLFNCHDAAAHYCGLSLFFNSNATAYGGNIVAPQSTLQQMLGVDHATLLATQNAVEAALTDLVAAKGYTGPVGVDMMLYGENDTQLCPTIEVNVRRTMGFVALALARFATSAPMIMRIIPNPLQQQSAAVDDSDTTIQLVPPSPHFAATLSPMP
jgi:hypothetical protein